MTIPITWVDAFSDVAFGGNPAAVCLLSDPLDDERMQSIAFELGIAETAFLTPTDDPTTFGLRWFSPADEIDLCGHATLASAHALRAGGVVDGSVPLTFHTRSGPLRAAFDGDRIELDFPADPMTPAPLPDPLQAQWPGAVVASGHSQFFSFVVLSSAEGVARVRARPGCDRRHRVQGPAAHGGGATRFRCRLRAACLRAQRGNRRGPRHRLGSVHGGAVLGGRAGPRHPRGPPALPARRGALRASRR